MSLFNILSSVLQILFHITQKKKVCLWIQNILTLYIITLQWFGEYRKIATNRLKAEIPQLLSNDNLICILANMTGGLHFCLFLWYKHLLF